MILKRAPAEEPSSRSRRGRAAFKSWCSPRRHFIPPHSPRRRYLSILAGYRRAQKAADDDDASSRRLAGETACGALRPASRLAEYQRHHMPFDTATAARRRSLRCFPCPLNKMARVSAGGDRCGDAARHHVEALTALRASRADAALLLAGLACFDRRGPSPAATMRAMTPSRR